MSAPPNAKLSNDLRRTDLLWRRLRARSVLLYLVNAVVIVALLGAESTLFAVNTGFGAATTLLMTWHLRGVLARHRDPSSGALPFDRARLRWSDVVSLPSTRSEHP